jgi:hypothetical protein
MSRRITRWSDWADSCMVSGWLIGEPRDPGFSAYSLANAKSPKFRYLGSSKLFNGSVYQSDAVSDGQHYVVLRAFTENRDSSYVIVEGFGNSEEMLTSLFDDLQESLELNECEVHEGYCSFMDSMAVDYAIRKLKGAGFIAGSGN